MIQDIFETRALYLRNQVGKFEVRLIQNRIFIFLDEMFLAKVPFLTFWFLSFLVCFEDTNKIIFHLTRGQYVILNISNQNAPCWKTLAYIHPLPNYLSASLSTRDIDRSPVISNDIQDFVVTFSFNHSF